LVKLYIAEDASREMRALAGRAAVVAVCRIAWAEMMAANPFPEAGRTDPSRLLVMVMKDEIKPGAVEGLCAFATGDEAVAAAAGTLFLWHPHGIGSSKMAEKAQPRLIGTGTGRNWSTVLKLANMVGL
jgi:uncharacterized protein (DUF1697 family)